MSFVHLWPIYLGAAAAALPLIVHWLTRPRPVRLPTSTLRFVREAVQQRRARNRLRDFAVLALRVAAVLLIGFAVARPLLGVRASQIVDAPDGIARVVVLDVSQSMAAQHAGLAAFERARSRAVEYLQGANGLRCNLILAGATPRSTFDQLSTNLRALHEELARSQSEPQRLHLQTALNLAGKQLSEAPGEKTVRELVVVSDFQRANWAQADFAAVPADTRIVLESVAPPETAANVAILRVDVQTRPVVDRPTRISVEVGNYSPLAKRVVCQVDVGESSFRMEDLCPAGSTLVLGEDFVLKRSGWSAGEARLVDHADALSADDARAFVFDAHLPSPYLLITRQRGDDAGASSFFVERALAPYLPTQQADRARVVRIDPDQLTADALAQSELILLDHPGKLAEPTVAMLVGAMQRGRSVWFLASEAADAVTLRQIADTAGASLQMPVEFLPPQIGRPRRDLFLTEVRPDQSPFRIFGDALPAHLKSLRFAGGLASQRLENGLADDVLAEFNDRSVALIATSCGAGMFAVLNAELGASNLPASPLFVPLVSEMAERLSGDRRQGSRIYSGEPVAVYLPSIHDKTGLRIATTTEADAPAGELVNESLGVLWRMAAAPPPGVYRVERDGATVSSLACELAPEESDLQTLSPRTIEQRMSAGRSVESRAEGDAEQRDDLWTWLMVAVAGVMLTELFVLRTARV